ncbi:uncharacterized protein F4807DRAFT_91590 [Annulohypoxylon truncatum]|uniref:uncharacterized protein n=1 Tax=Annulohypoxylon truncatum TaxID=327061 RepID=UPI002008DB21|nr:uncharacterized protein F4807DRAFT_91590 [Annulohypoxylon truncatum]KAI1209370.1 hypothetical protein F4807DRAFT_91590 [Annulohypoxylon truncatum]
MFIILLISLITSVYGLCAPYPMGNDSTTLSQPTFATTVTISVRPGSRRNNHTGSVVSAPYPTGANRGIGALTSPAVANLSNNATGPSCGWNCSSPTIQTPVPSPVVFSSVPWNNDDDPSLPSVITIWPWPNTTSPDTSSPPPPEVPTYTPTPRTTTTTVNVTGTLGILGCSSSTLVTTTTSSVPVSQSTGIPIASNGGPLNSQGPSSTTSGSNTAADNTAHAGQAPAANTGPGTLDQQPNTSSSTSVPITSTLTTPTTTPTATVRVIPVTD